MLRTDSYEYQVRTVQLESVVSLTHVEPVKFWLNETEN